MTRINAGIVPSRLVDAHAFIEYRELTRIPSAVLARTPVVAKLPPTFRLGEGHMRFFYNKIEYIYNKYITVHDDVVARGYTLNQDIVERNLANFDRIRKTLPHLWNNYNDKADAVLLRERIAERLRGMNKFKYHGKAVTIDEALAMLY